jgi:hypothetical protein
MGGDFGQFTIRKEHLAHKKQLETFKARYLLLPNGFRMAARDGVWPCTVRLQDSLERARPCTWQNATFTKSSAERQ